MQPAGIEHSCEVVIHGQPAHVFAVLSALEQYLARWAKGPVAAKKLTPGEAVAGTRFEVTANSPGYAYGRRIP